MAASRRDFLKIAGVSSAGAVAFGGCMIPARDMKVESPTRIPEDLVTGRDNWYATAGTRGNGIIVRVMEGRALKVEGNPDHPVNQGKSNAWDQALVQLLYHPDRYQRPMRLNGARGSGSYSDLSWNDALAQAAEAIRGATGGRLVLMTPPLSGPSLVAVEAFVRAFGGSHLTLDLNDDAVYRAAVQRVFGADVLPDYDLPRANTVLSIGADWLGAWGNPVRQGIGYGQFRQGKATRGYLIHIDSRFSVTAANADEYIPCRPGTEGLVALSIAHALIAGNFGDRGVYPSGGAQALAAFSGNQVAQQTGVPAERITAIAQRLGQNGPAVVIGGGSAGAHTNGLFNLVQILNLNILLGAVGAPGGVRLNPAPPTIPNVQSPFRSGASSFTTWQGEMIRLRQVGSNAVVLVYNANPVFALPPSLGVRDVLLNAGRVISFSTLPDETSELADLILPSHSPLEEWGVEAPAAPPGFQVVTFKQPVVNRVFDTRQFGDTILDLMRAIGGEVVRSVPFPTIRDGARLFAQPLFDRRAGSVTADSFDLFLNGVQQRGGWWSTTTTQAATPRPVGFASAPEPARIAGDDSYPFFLQPFMSPTLGSPEGAQLPWLQQTPDPVTTMAWGTWVEINRRVANQLGVKEGDVVVVESPNGRIEAPVYINYGTPDWTVAIPVGNGHTAGGRWQKGVGVNPIGILADLTDQQTGALAWAATKVRLTRTGRSVPLSKLEGYVPAVQLEHAEALKITNKDS
ncbi:MAG: menaquinone reductase, molybdopterin-binding-like subunit [Dehalococcoidia bacterium]|nr:MAG: menaquinone reductase, molybdopterin-binding-like subunit [Dehalococcoidia bacterium]